MAESAVCIFRVINYEVSTSRFGMVRVLHSTWEWKRGFAQNVAAIPEVLIADSEVLHSLAQVSWALTSEMATDLTDPQHPAKPDGESTSAVIIVQRTLESVTVQLSAEPGPASPLRQGITWTECVSDARPEASETTEIQPDSTSSEKAEDGRQS